ncbi:hypothetical protein [Acidaminococcus sp. LBK-2]|uniref:hypothetical protein n=1 Tax=Acidaminococcus sp. LBK-2 TaxID=3456956 RepID=UPI003FA45F2D
MAELQKLMRRNPVFYAENLPEWNARSFGSWYFFAFSLILKGVFLLWQTDV